MAYASDPGGSDYIPPDLSKTGPLRTPYVPPLDKGLDRVVESGDWVADLFGKTNPNPTQVNQWPRQVNLNPPNFPDEPAGVGQNRSNFAAGPLDQLLKTPEGYSSTPDWLKTGPPGYTPSSSLPQEGYSPTPDWLMAGPGGFTPSPGIKLPPGFTPSPGGATKAEAQIEVPFPTADRTDNPTYTLLTGDDLREYLADTMGPWKDYLDKIYQVGGVHAAAITDPKHDTTAAVWDATNRALGVRHPRPAPEKWEVSTGGGTALPTGVRYPGEPERWVNAVAASKDNLSALLHEGTHGLIYANNQLREPGDQEDISAPSNQVTPEAVRRYLKGVSPLRGLVKSANGYDLAKDIQEIPTTLTEVAAQIEHPNWDLRGWNKQSRLARLLAPYDDSAPLRLPADDEKVALEQFWRLDNLLNQMLAQEQKVVPPEELIQ